MSPDRLLDIFNKILFGSFRITSRVIGKAVKPLIPKKFQPALSAFFIKMSHVLYWSILNRLKMTALFIYTDLRETSERKISGFKSVPPARLRYRVNGYLDLAGFLEIGQQNALDIKSTLMKNGKGLGAFRHVLDFGCGCGRTIMWLNDGTSKYHGTDIDRAAIDWCRKKLSFAEFGVNASLPPLDYPSGTFDLIYAISVFTHLNEEYQFSWLSELRRVAKPEGTIFLTVHGPDSLDTDHPSYIQLYGQLKGRGFLFLEGDKSGTFPKWYQSSFHTERYIRKEYTKYLNVLDFIPKGCNNHQDIVVLKKKN